MSAPTGPLAYRADRLLLGMIGLYALAALALGWRHEALAWVLPLVAGLVTAAGLVFWRTGGTLASRMLLALLAITLAALHIQLAQGQLAAHFGIFATLTFLLVYLDWRPLLGAAGLATLHHVGFGLLQLAGWPVHVLPQPDGPQSLVVMACVALQTGVECVIVHILYTLFVRDMVQQRAVLTQQDLLSTAVNESDSAIVVSGLDRRIVFANAGCVRMFGYSPEELIGRLPTEVLTGPHTDARVIEEIRAKAISGEGYCVELLAYTKDRRPLWVSVVVNPVLDAEGRVRNFVGVLADITQTKMHEVLQYKVLDAMARETPMLDVMTLVCREVERIAPEVVATILAIDAAGLVRPLAAPSLPEQFAQALDGLPIGPHAGACGTAAWRNEPVLALDIANDPLWEAYGALALPLGLRACWSSPICGSDGQVLGTFAFYYREPREPSPLHRRLVDVCLHLCTLCLEREKAKAHIHQLAFYDSLTGLANRAMLLSKAERVLHEARRSHTPLTVLFIDLDRFKQVNDTQGHMAGDALLKELARRLESFARDADVVGRLSGDEFVAVLSQCSAAQASNAAERLVAAIAQPVEVLGVTLHPTASIGVAVFPEDGTDVDTLVRHADMAMYQAKPQGRRRYQFFSAELNRAAQERAMLEADLRAALADDGLALHYQPQIASGDASLYGVEALLRWAHPQLGAVPPLRFVALAEECGLIRALGAWVLAQACRQMADWRRRGIAVPHVAVNLSASNFHEADLPQTVARVLRDHGLSPDDLVLEMTESVMLSADPVVLATLEAVHALGVRLSMDDFGTGYSSLSYLHRLPIDELKLDKSFVHDIEHSDMSRALTTSVLRIGKSLGMRVVAEGVETEAQRAFLVAGECPVLQGYLFSRPVAADQLELWLEEHTRQQLAPLAPLAA